MQKTFNILIDDSVEDGTYNTFKYDGLVWKLLEEKRAINRFNNSGFSHRIHINSDYLEKLKQHLISLHVGRHGTIPFFKIEYK